MEKRSNGKAVASLVLGIIACVTIFTGLYAIIGVVVGIVGIIIGVIAKKEQPCGMATAGLVLSIIAVALCLITFVACLCTLGGLAAYGVANGYIK